MGTCLTQVCLEIPWDSSQDEQAIEWCVCYFMEMKPQISHIIFELTIDLYKSRELVSIEIRFFHVRSCRWIWNALLFITETT